jgi:hypothetical protein
MLFAELEVDLLQQQAALQGNVSNLQQQLASLHDELFASKAQLSTSEQSLQESVVQNESLVADLAVLNARINEVRAQLSGKCFHALLVVQLDVSHIFSRQIFKTLPHDLLWTSPRKMSILMPSAAAWSNFKPKSSNFALQLQKLMLLLKCCTMTI